MALPSYQPSSLVFVSSGTGEPVLLIHGLYGTGRTLDILRAGLDTGFHVIAPDIRGHGDSPHPGGPIDAEAMARDLVALLDRLNVRTAHVVGYSHGGATAQVLARLAPDRVRSLVLISAYAYQPLTMRERVFGWLLPSVVRIVRTPLFALSVRVTRVSVWGPRLSPERASTYAREASRNQTSTMAQALAEARGFDSRSWLAGLTMPTLVIHGTTDLMASYRQTDLLINGIPQARRVGLTGAGHLAPYTHDAEIVPAIREWLLEQESVTRPQSEHQRHAQPVSSPVAAAIPVAR